ncbi:hypothetical protein DFP72DRAFT_272283 [Ephemerocybe angulata]|uniref:Uncharacterized protein n=1 Tax=Ephemerocybe angulata TaxID=980116 RepID=A0A8H6I394_9AGAR|nr:hypothetical protein DFP72DRAFT_272283 [Tulosesus angulatus]
MVHRPADARLLSSLVSHEKDYSKHLSALLASSQSSQASLAAYAAASPPITSRTILNVAAIFAAADDAHARYAQAVEEWRDMLRGLHALEEEVGNVIRDREILVTRLIKAAKSSKPVERIPSTSNHSLRSPSLSSISLRDRDSSHSQSYFSYLVHQLPGTSSSSSSHQQPRSLAPTTTKLAAAQSELQACETHLAAKERELELRRVQVIRDGLALRSRAMVETGRSWVELGKEAVQAVEAQLGFGLSGNQEQDGARPRYQDHHRDVRRTPSVGRMALSSLHDDNGGKATPPGGYPASSSEEDLSSANHAHHPQVQHKAGELRIPAAHAIMSEIDMPIPLMNHNTTMEDGGSRSRRSSAYVNREEVGPPVPTKRHSYHGNSRPQSRGISIIEASPNRVEDLTHPEHPQQTRRPHLHHVAPRARVSWVSVTDTEEDWVDAGEGGEELDEVFGTPRKGAGATFGNIGSSFSSSSTNTNVEMKENDSGTPVVNVPVNPSTHDHHTHHESHTHHPSQKSHHETPDPNSPSQLNPHSKPFVPSLVFSSPTSPTSPTPSKAPGKDLPAPPALGGLYPFASAPGSVFESAEYKGARERRRVSRGSPCPCRTPPS